MMSFVMNDVCMNMLHTLLWPISQENSPLVAGAQTLHRVSG